MEPSVVGGRDWSPVSSSSNRAQSPWLVLSNFVSTTGPYCSQGVQPGGICAYVVHREPTPGPRARAGAGAAGASYLPIPAAALVLCSCLGRNSQLITTMGGADLGCHYWSFCRCWLVGPDTGVSLAGELATERGPERVRM
jgi:hypothetical protein